jgi:uncharacterized membrane protein
MILALLLVGAAATMPETAQAYFGPGAGVTMLGALWGVILALAFAVFAFLAWPIRALLRRRKKAATAGTASVTGAAAAARDAGR